MTKLADWLFEQKLTPTDLTKMLGFASRNTVKRYLIGARYPDCATIARIEIITKGKVTASDFMDTRRPECVSVRKLPNGKEQWVYPWTTGKDAMAAVVLTPTEVREESKLPPLPIQRALTVLGQRVAPGRVKGKYILDGRATDSRGIVIAANKVLAERGLKPIFYPLANPK